MTNNVGIVEITGDTTLKEYKDIDFEWKELTEMHKTVAEELYNNSLRLKALLTSNVFDDYHDDIRLSKLALTGNMAAGKLEENLTKIRDQHISKNGKLRNKEDYWLATKLHGNYKDYRQDMLVTLAFINKKIIELKSILTEENK